MRPELVAFRELDTLVRNLSDQLAGYRRRAMAAEARTRELEGLLTAAQLSARDAQRLVAESEHALGDAMRGRTIAEAEAASATSALAKQEAARLAALARVRQPEAMTTVDGSPASAQPSTLELENGELRSLLGEARERIAQLLERARFLRQQMGVGAEK